MSERLWFKIGETAARIGATPKELRYWEKVIPELRPRRSKGNLRYYHVDEFPPPPEDPELALRRPDGR